MIFFLRENMRTHLSRVTFRYYYKVEKKGDLKSRTEEKVRALRNQNIYDRIKERKNRTF